MDPSAIDDYQYRVKRMQLKSQGVKNRPIFKALNTSLS